jgi:hypothetical protein
MFQIWIFDVQIQRNLLRQLLLVQSVKKVEILRILQATLAAELSHLQNSIWTSLHSS